MCQMIVGKKKKKIPVFPFRVDMSPDCRQGFKQFKTPIKFQRREENPGVLIHTDAVQLSQGLPFPSVYRKVSGIQYQVLKPQFSGEINQSPWKQSQGEVMYSRSEQREALHRTR